MRKSLFATIALFFFALIGLAYVLASGPERLPEFDYSRYLPESQYLAPVRIAVIEDLRCPGCRKSHMEVLPKVLDLVERTDFAVVHIPYPVARVDSLALNVMAQTYAIYHGRLPSEVNALLFEADAPRLSMAQAENLLLSRYGAIDSTLRADLELAAERTLRENVRYLRSLGIGTVPTVIVNGVVLHAPRAEVLAEQIRAAFPQPLAAAPELGVH